MASDFAFIPFGGGARKCVGDQFAMFEATVAMAMLLRRFTFRLAVPVEKVRSWERFLPTQCGKYCPVLTKTKARRDGLKPCTYSALCGLKTPKGPPISPPFLAVPIAFV